MMDNNISYTGERQAFRSPISSNVQNKRSDAILFDLLNLANRTNSITERMDHVSELLNIEETYNGILVNTLLNKIKALSEHPGDSKYRTKVLTLNDIYTDSNSFSTSNLDYVNNAITLPYASAVSKLILKDDLSGEVFIPNGLTATFNVKTSGVKSVKSNAALTALAGSEDMWCAKILTDKGINFIEAELIIEMPNTIIDSKDINTLIINPFPLKSLDITGIKYKLHGDWIDVPGLSSHSEATPKQYGGIVSYVFEEAGNLMFNFKEVAASSIKLLFKQKQFIETPEGNVFYIGAKDVKVENRQYSQMSGSFYVKAEFNEEDPILIQEIVSIANNYDQLISNTISYELFTLDDNDIPTRIMSLPTQILNKKMLIKCNFHKSPTTPSISSIQVKYSI